MRARGGRRAQARWTGPLARATPTRCTSSCGWARTSTHGTRYVKQYAASTHVGQLSLQAGETALMLAAGNGHAATAAELVRLGANVNAKDYVRQCTQWKAGAAGREVADRCAACDLAGRDCAHVRYPHGSHRHGYRARTARRGHQREGPCTCPLQLRAWIGASVRVRDRYRSIDIASPVPVFLTRACQHNGWTALSNAVQHSHTVTAVELVRLGADLTVRDRVCIHISGRQLGLGVRV
jgi:hypothetical protein